MNLAVLGLGYIGLPTAAMFANAGFAVVGVDIDKDRIEDILCGCRHLTESGVRDVARSALESGNLTLATSLPAYADAYVICVPTPTRSRKPDLRYVEDAAEQVARRAADGNLIVLESTVPPGTVENVIAGAFRAAGKSPDSVHIAHCPERVIPGAVVQELRNNPRVIGGRRPGDAEKARALYASFCTGEISLTDCITAELVKVVENTYRDVNLAFANELAVLAETLGTDAWEVIRLANNHPRVNVLNPGPGVGGHCIPVDPQFLSNANPFVTELIQTARRVNERMPHVVARMAEDLLAPFLGTRVTLLGAAYKADIEDTRESPALQLIGLLQEKRRSIKVYDPLARNFSYDLTPSLHDAVRDADLLIVVTDHRDFAYLDPVEIGTLMRRRNVIDSRNILNRRAWIAAGFTVRVLGVPHAATDRVETARSA